MSTGLLLSLLAYGGGTLVLLLFAGVGWLGIRLERYLRLRELDKRTALYKHQVDKRKNP